jgi:hypothetical protein
LCLHRGKIGAIPTSRPQFEIFRPMKSLQFGFDSKMTQPKTTKTTANSKMTDFLVLEIFRSIRLHSTSHVRARGVGGTLARALLALARPLLHTARARHARPHHAPQQCSTTRAAAQPPLHASTTTQAPAAGAAHLQCRCCNTHCCGATLAGRTLIKPARGCPGLT